MNSLAAGFARTCALQNSIFKFRPRVSLRDAPNVSIFPPSSNHARSLTRSFASQVAKAAPIVVESLPQHANGQSSTVTRVRLQSFDYTGLVACMKELEKVWLPAKVEDAVQFAPYALALRLRTLTETGWLYISWHPSTAHIGTSLQIPPRGAVSEAFSFGEQVQSALKGLVLTEAIVPTPWERMARLSFAQRPEEAPSFLLHIEVMGRYSNVILTGGGGNVLAAGHQVGSKMSSARAVQVGKQYYAPPGPMGIPPDACQSPLEWQEAVSQGDKQVDNGKSATSVARCCVRVFLGVSPALMHDLCSTAGVNPNARLSSLEPSDWGRLYEQWNKWIQRIEESSFECTSTPEGGYSMLGRDRHDGLHESPLHFIREYYASFDNVDEFDRAKHRVARAVSNGLNRLARKIESLKRQASEPDVHMATKKLADLLMAHLHLAEPGSESVTVEDWDTGEPLSISLDPLKTAVASAETLYAKARKQRRAVDQVAPLVEEAQAQIEYLKEVELLLQQLELGDGQDMEALKQMESELIAGSFMKPTQGASLAEKAASKARRAAKRSGKGRVAAGDDAKSLRRFTTPCGLVVLVGRNSGQNDVLTTKMAQPNDVWMHARGVPGAHVLLRVPSGQTASESDLQFAADIAAFYSKSRLEGKAEVTMASPLDITKPRGAKPGQVLVKKERVMLGKPANSAPAAVGGGD